MSALRTIVLAALAVLLASCVLEKRARRATHELDRSLVFVEQRRSGFERPLHAADEVPLETGVDVDSTILVKVDKQALLAQFKGAGLGTSESPDALGARKQKVVAALDEYAIYLRAGAELGAAFAEFRLARESGVDRSAQRARFAAARKAANDAEGAFMTKLGELWPEGTPEEGEIRAILEVNSRDMTGMREFLQRQIDRLDREFAAAQATAKARTVSLRLEAVLERDDADPEGVHLEGYDDLKAGKLRYADRTGLAMSEEDVKKLAEMMQAATELSAAANRVLQGEAEFAAAFASLDGRIAGAIGQRLAELDRLAKLFEAGAITKRFDDGRAAFAALAGDVTTIARDAAEGLRISAANAPDALLTRIVAANLAPLHDALEIVDEVRDLPEAWRTVTPATLPGLLARTTGLARRVRGLAAKVEPLLKSLEPILAEAAKQHFDEWRGLGAAALAELETTWRDSEAKRFVTELVADVRAVRDALEFFGELAGVANTPRPSGTIRVPEARAVSLERVTDTFLPLPRTTRRPGDFVTIRSTLLRHDAAGAEQPLQDSIASFKVERFGWHADLEPAVTLVKPDHLSGGSDRLNFAPMIGWMHRYLPYPEDEDWLGLRTLKPAFGVHATFLNFDPDHELEIGLGGTLSFFDGILMGGVGYNLMAEDRGEGDVYYFVGSSLIPLLQATGLSGG